MTDPELAATYSYTTEKSGWHHYRRLNDELRNALDAGRAPAQRVEDYMLTLNDALDRMPDQAGTFWRGVSLSAAERASYIPGSVHTWAAFSSSSRKKEKAFRRNALFRVKGRHGKDIKGYSAYASEDEVLFRAGTRVRVIELGQERDGRLRVEVEEIDDGQ